MICDSFVTDKNVKTIMKCLVCHNMAHDILIGHQFRQLQILLLHLHIRKQMAIGGEFGAMLAVWDIASNQVACSWSYYCFRFIL